MGVGILVIIPTLAYPLPVSACSPPEVEPWFIEIFHVPPIGENLIKYLEFEVMNNGESLSLINSSDLPLYVLRADYKVNDEINFHSSDFPPGFGAIFVLYSGNAYYWEMLGLSKYEWNRVGYDKPSNLLLRVVNFNSLLGYDYSLLQLEPKNKAKDDRPKVVSISEPQFPNLLIVYNGELIQIPLEISYKLNPRYISNGVEISYKACDELDEPTPIKPISKNVDFSKDNDIKSESDVNIAIYVATIIGLGFLYFLSLKKISLHDNALKHIPK